MKKDCIDRIKYLDAIGDVRKKIMHNLGSISCDNTIPCDGFMDSVQGPRVIVPTLDTEKECVEYIQFLNTYLERAVDKKTLDKITEDTFKRAVHFGETIGCDRSDPRQYCSVCKVLDEESGTEGTGPKIAWDEEGGEEGCMGRFRMGRTNVMFRVLPWKI